MFLGYNDAAKLPPFCGLSKGENDVAAPFGEGLGF
jgi:hypothetical protein